ncbi:phosphatase PAP2 family protein [Hymenobacter cellulosilyticus]|uniref:Phosphatase PAP2 family protein n=1 Tax=Hymenobacter cellulosilyticus TaxID=2932248 RepID=A0A8T9QDU6_9BACT|nr:phosphatase PAP2 family protein [Hymenobacter cellulosilyticus]UOQ73739.1 phosphatase PAP2 family protein [Hymenobacter cellulosilyticus]
MLFFHLRLLLALLVVLASSAPGEAQIPFSSQADTLHKYEEPSGTGERPAGAWYQKKLVRASAVPLVLISAGIACLDNHSGMGNNALRTQIQAHFPGFHTTADNYLQYMPYLELGTATLFGIQSHDDRLNTLLLIAKSELLMSATVTAVKYSTHMLRPDASAHNSFPSGHTAQAFLAASIVHEELRNKSQWYGVGAYSLAAGVGTLRMLNNKHWESDVLAGAGFGILSAHLAYLSHRNRWGHKPVDASGQWQLAPLWLPGGTGLCVRWQPR